MIIFPCGTEIGISSGNPRLGFAGYAVDGAARLKFTGKERDAETGLDYFEARYMSSAPGRWTNPHAPFVDQQPEDPRIWNLYDGWGWARPARCFAGDSPQ